MNAISPAGQRSGWLQSRGAAALLKGDDIGQGQTLASCLLNGE